MEDDKVYTTSWTDHLGRPWSHWRLPVLATGCVTMRNSFEWFKPQHGQKSGESQQLAWLTTNADGLPACRLSSYETTANSDSGTR